MKSDFHNLTVKELVRKYSITYSLIFAVRNHFNIKFDTSKMRKFDHNKIKELYKSGQSIPDIASEVGCVEATISRALYFIRLEDPSLGKRAGCFYMGFKMSDDDFIKHYNAGLGVKEIAKLCGVNPGTVHRRKRVLLFKGMIK